MFSNEAGMTGLVRGLQEGSSEDEILVELLESRRRFIGDNIVVTNWTELGAVKPYKDTRLRHLKPKCGGPLKLSSQGLFFPREDGVIWGISKPWLAPSAWFSEDEPKWVVVQLHAKEGEQASVFSHEVALEDLSRFAKISFSEMLSEISGLFRRSEQRLQEKIVPQRAINDVFGAEDALLGVLARSNAEKRLIAAIAACRAGDYSDFQVVRELTHYDRVNTYEIAAGEFAEWIEKSQE